MNDALKRAVGIVLEGWTLPDDVRKILEAAYWAATPAPEPQKEAMSGVKTDFMRRVDAYLVSIGMAATPAGQTEEAISAAAEPAWMAAFDEARDAILNDRGPLEGEAMTDTQTNAVLSILDDAFMPHLKRAAQAATPAPAPLTADQVAKVLAPFQDVPEEQMDYDALVHRVMLACAEAWGVRLAVQGKEAK